MYDKKQDGARFMLRARLTIDLVNTYLNILFLIYNRSFIRIFPYNILVKSL